MPLLRRIKIFHDDFCSFTHVIGSTPHSSFYQKTSGDPYSKGVVNPYYAASNKEDEMTKADSIEFNVIKTAPNDHNG